MDNGGGGELEHGAEANGIERVALLLERRNMWREESEKGEGCKVH